MKMLRSDVLKNRLERVKNITAPHRESKKDELIFIILSQMIEAMMNEALGRMYNPLPKVIRGKGGEYLVRKEFFVRDIGGIYNGQPESESDFIKRKLIYNEKKRCLN